MRQINIGILFVLCLSLFTFCSTPDELGLEKPTFDSPSKGNSVLQSSTYEIGTVSGADLTITADLSALQNGFNNYWTEFLAPNAANAPLNTPYLLESGSYYYLVMSASFNTEDLSVVSTVELEEDNGGLFLASGATVHSCTGVRCTSCKYTFNAGGQVTGCDCNTVAPGETSGYCNHSISGGAGPDLPAEIIAELEN